MEQLTDISPGRRRSDGPYTPPPGPAPTFSRSTHREYVGPFTPHGFPPPLDTTLDRHREAPRLLARELRGGRRVARVAVRVDVGYEEWGAASTLRPLPRREPVAQVPPAVTPAEPSNVADDPLLLRAADRIEAVARRVRRGELRPLGLTAGITEAGALAAALAALLTPQP